VSGAWAVEKRHSDVNPLMPSDPQRIHGGTAELELNLAETRPRIFIIGTDH
jgi:hypothetical protein